MPAKSDDGKIIIAGTILHMDSLLEQLMPRTNNKYTVEEDLKLYSINPKSLWKAVKYRAHNEDFSKILWKESWSKEKLKALREEYVQMGMPDVYSREYLNYPIDETTAYFRREDFLPYSDEDYESNVVYYSAVDFAISKESRADFTVICTVGINSQGTLLVEDIRRGRWDSQEIIEEMFSVQQRYKPDLFIVEKGAIQKAIGPFLETEMLRRNVYLNLQQEVPTKDKMSRARGIQARLRAGGIRFDKEASWYPTLEDEMARFPKDRHDDQVDALAWIGLVLDKMQTPPTPEEEEEEEYNEMVWLENQQGRSLTTGY